MCRTHTIQWTILETKPFLAKQTSRVKETRFLFQFSNCTAIGDQMVSNDIANVLHLEYIAPFQDMMFILWGKTLSPDEEDTPADGGELSLLLDFLRKHFELLLEWFFMVIRVHIVVIGDDRRQELGTGEAEQLLKHLQVSEMISTKHWSTHLPMNAPRPDLSIL